MRKSITEIANAWYASSDEVHRFGGALLEAGIFDSDHMRGAAVRLLDYFEKPWHWDVEHAWWVANGWTNNPVRWGEGEEGEWVDTIPQRLAYIRGEIEAEQISMTEIIELQGLADEIDPSDVLLLEWAGVPEFSE